MHLPNKLIHSYSSLSLAVALALSACSSSDAAGASPDAQDSTDAGTGSTDGAQGTDGSSAVADATPAPIGFQLTIDGVSIPTKDVMTFAYESSGHWISYVHAELVDASRYAWNKSGERVYVEVRDDQKTLGAPRALASFQCHGGRTVATDHTAFALGNIGPSSDGKDSYAEFAEVDTALSCSVHFASWGDVYRGSGETTLKKSWKNREPYVLPPLSMKLSWNHPKTGEF